MCLCIFEVPFSREILSHFVTILCNNLRFRPLKTRNFNSVDPIPYAFFPKIHNFLSHIRYVDFSARLNSVSQFRKCTPSPSTPYAFSSADMTYATTREQVLLVLTMSGKRKKHISFVKGRPTNTYT